LSTPCDVDSKFQKIAIMLKFIQLGIKILSELRLIPHCSLISKTHTNETNNELSKVKQELQATTLNLRATKHHNTDLEDKYKQMILMDHMQKQDLEELNKETAKLEAQVQKQKQEVKKLTNRLTIATVGLDTASQENLQVQQNFEELTIQLTALTLEHQKYTEDYSQLLKEKAELQAQIETATTLSKQLKEALDRWTS